VPSKTGGGARSVCSPKLLLVVLQVQRLDSANGSGEDLPGHISGKSRVELCHVR
jgi:hypothetical protein